jgi:hypothetical protein
MPFSRILMLTLALFAIACGRIGYEPIDDDPTGAAPPDAPRPTSSGVLRPSAGASWQIQLTGTIDTTLDVPFYVVDMDVPVDVLAALHAEGRFVACYFSGGTWEPFRADASAFPAASKGNAVDGYPRERWLDVRLPEVRAIMEDRIATALGRGCDGISASGLAAYADNTGFALTMGDQIDYDLWLADATHVRGRAIGLEDGDPSFARDLVADFDWVLVWDCLDVACNRAPPFTEAGKPGFLVSVAGAAQAPGVCAAGAKLGLSTILKRSSLDGFRVACP